MVFRVGVMVEGGAMVFWGGVDGNANPPGWLGLLIG